VQAADGNDRTLLLLLEAGADVTAKQDHKIGFSAMNQAAYFGHARCLRHLLAFKADVNILDAYGGTPLVAASLNGEEECVKVLVEAGANVNHPTANGNTPLMKAALNGHSTSVRMLIVAGADVALKNSKGENALDLATRNTEPLTKKLVEFQKEHYESDTHAVTYNGLRGQGFTTYMWDATVLPHGGFRYTTESGSVITDPIDREEIGEFTMCDSSEIFCKKTEILGLSTTKAAASDRVPIGTPYGWDHDANCWTYFTDATSDKPTHYAKYTKNTTSLGKSNFNAALAQKQQAASLGTAEKLFRERKREFLRKDLRRYFDCIDALKKSVEDIREEDWASIKEKDSSRKESHIKSFEMQALALRRELEALVKVSTSEFCCVVNDQERQDILDQVVRQFKAVMQQHQRRSAKWYNDDLRYRSGVIEMLSMKDNAMAVPLLTKTMYQEWKIKQSFLRQANRMVLRERFRLALLHN
jgi:hypothetical protein